MPTYLQQSVPKIFFSGQRRGLQSSCSSEVLWDRHGERRSSLPFPSCHPRMRLNWAGWEIWGGPSNLICRRYNLNPVVSQWLLWMALQHSCSARSYSVRGCTVSHRRVTRSVTKSIAKNVQWAKSCRLTPVPPGDSFPWTGSSPEPWGRQQAGSLHPRLRCERLCLPPPPPPPVGCETWRSPPTAKQLFTVKFKCLLVGTMRECKCLYTTSCNLQ